MAARLDLRTLAAEIQTSDPSRRGFIFQLVKDFTNNFSNNFDGEEEAVATIRSIGEQRELYRNHASSLLTRGIDSTQNLCIRYPQIPVFVLAYLASTIISIHYGISIPYFSTAAASIVTLGWQLIKNNLPTNPLGVEIIENPRATTQPSHAIAAESSVRRFREPDYLFDEEYGSAFARRERLDSAGDEISLANDTFVLGDRRCNKYRIIINFLLHSDKNQPVREDEMNFLSLLLTQGFGITGENQEMIDRVLAIRHLETAQEKVQAFYDLIENREIKQKFEEAINH